MILESPEVLVTRKMGPKQEELLRRIVATNGGGVYFDSSLIKLAKALIERGFIQGKSGQPWRMVHTDIGLAEIRRLNAARTSTAGDATNGQ